MDKRLWTVGVVAVVGTLLGLRARRPGAAARSAGPPPFPPPDASGVREPRRPLPTSGAGSVQAPL